MDNVSTTELEYLSGFGNEFATEALAGALPKGQNSPQKPPLGLYAELLSGTAFTVPREFNRRTWFYRIRPSASHGKFRQIDSRLIRGTPFDEVPAPPGQLRWNPLGIPADPTDFIDGLVSYAGGGDAAMGAGLAIHLYAANAAMADRFFYNADGEMLMVPQRGRLRLITEMGVIEAAPNEIAVVPRGVKFRVELPDGPSRGYVCENYGAPLRLPSLGPIGSNGLANPRDFLTPVAAFEDREGDFQLICKFGGRLWAADIGHSPLDAVAWHGNYAPYKYDLADFQVIGSVSFDHPDPSIYTVLTSPSESPGTANIDFVIFPPRWMVAEHTFRPPWYHRNVMSEFMGLVSGVYDAKPEGFIPGGASLHNSMTAHGPDADSFAAAREAEQEPQFQGDTMAIMFETRMQCRVTKFALDTDLLQKDYVQCWRDMPKHFEGRPHK